LILPITKLDLFFLCVCTYKNDISGTSGTKPINGEIGCSRCAR